MRAPVSCLASSPEIRIAFAVCMLRLWRRHEAVGPSAKDLSALAVASGLDEATGWNNARRLIVWDMALKEAVRRLRSERRHCVAP